MKQTPHGSGCVTFMIAAPLVLIGVALLFAGLRTAPEVLTEDGYSERLIYLIAAGGFLVSGLGVLFFSLLARAGTQVEERQRQHIQETYREAVARIQKVEPGTKLGNEEWTPVLLTLEVVLPGKSPYTVKWDGEVDKSFSGQLRPNEWLRVQVSPRDAQELHIQWGEAAKAPAHLPP
jgi:hypothetical protein